MRAALALLLLAGCADRTATNADAGAMQAAASALAACERVCPTASTPMAVGTYVSDQLTVVWSCGCLGAEPVRAR